ncbi:hypothetical protein KP509_08G040800 [Ceratopteris richardii]|uniref:Tf2-1-like SH3-like domain-containing protein n=1 Tax=Ceratopteris richardii TaxID=49495 RepID=A0A8T2U7E1_CERRI|nr:hypothetical protein KP509_08G040800 [Ceratopteris richardii]
MNYGMNHTAFNTIGISQKCPSALEFLANVQVNLEIAKAKIQQEANRAKEYADRKRSPRSLEAGDRVFLQVPTRSTSLSTGSVVSYHQGFCGPWRTVKNLGKVAYRLDLPLDCRFHPVFHVSREDNLIEGIVSLQESKSTDHKSTDDSPDRILNWRQK